MGFAMTPMPAIVLSRVKPDHAATAAGVLSTAQQAGGAIGVALIGGLLPRPRRRLYSHAFQVGLEVMAALGLAVAALVQLLPRTS